MGARQLTLLRALLLPLLAGESPKNRGESEPGFEKRGRPRDWKGLGEVGWEVGEVERLAGGSRTRGWRRPLRGGDTVHWGAGMRLLRVLPA